MRRKRDNRRPVAPHFRFEFADFLGCFVAVHLRHGDIHQDDTRRLFAPSINSLRAVFHDGELYIDVIEDVFDVVLVGFVIFSDENIEHFATRDNGRLFAFVRRIFRCRFCVIENSGGGRSGNCSACCDNRSFCARIFRCIGHFRRWQVRGRFDPLLIQFCFRRGRIGLRLGQTSGDGIEQLRRARWLDQNTAQAVVQHPPCHFVFADRSQHQNRNVGDGFIRTQLVEEILAGHIGHLEINNHEIDADAFGACFTQDRQAFLSTIDSSALALPVAHLLGQDIAVDRVVIDDQNLRSNDLDRSRFRFLDFFADWQRQLDDEGTALINHTFNRDIATHHFDQAGRDTEAETRAFILPRIRAIDLTELLKDAANLIGWDTNAGIFHANREASHISLDVTSNVDEDVTGFGKLDRVTDQVCHDLTHPPNIANEGRWQIRVIADEQIEVLRRSRAGQQSRDIFDALTQQERLVVDLRLTRLDFRVIENVVDDFHQRGATLRNRIGKVTFAWSQIRIAEQLGHTDDTIHRRTNFVAHIGQEFRLRDLRRLRSRQGRLHATHVC